MESWNGRMKEMKEWRSKLNIRLFMFQAKDGREIDGDEEYGGGRRRTWEKQ